MRPCPPPRPTTCGDVAAFYEVAPHARSPPGMGSQLLIVVTSILKDNHYGDTASLRALLNRWTGEEARPSIPASVFMFALA